MVDDVAFDVVFDLVWYAIVLFVTYGFIWGDAADKAYEINARIGKFYVKRLRDKEEYRAIAKVLAVVFFVFCTTLMLLRLRDYFFV